LQRHSGKERARDVPGQELKGKRVRGK